MLVGRLFRAGLRLYLVHVAGKFYLGQELLQGMDLHGEIWKEWLTKTVHFAGGKHLAALASGQVVTLHNLEVGKPRRTEIASPLQGRQLAKQRRGLSTLKVADQVALTGENG